MNCSERSHGREKWYLNGKAAFPMVRNNDGKTCVGLCSGSESLVFEQTVECGVVALVDEGHQTHLAPTFSLLSLTGVLVVPSMSHGTA